MKKIKITIREFLENGGVLNPGRDTFRNATDNNPSGWILRYDEERHVYLCDNNRIKSYPITTDFHYVEIECKPIYK